MNYWLLKSEPGSYSIDHLAQEKNQTTSWDGVRNYQARNFMRDDMKIGDECFFYHSNCKQIGIVGTAKVVKLAHPDFTALDPEDHHYDPKASKDNPRWCMVDIRLQKKFKQIIELNELKQNPKLKDMMILRKGNRLSITPVSPKEWQAILKMGS